MILFILFIIALAAAATTVVYFATRKRDKPSPGPSPGPGPSPSPPPPSGPTTPADVDIDMFFPPYDCPTETQTMIDIGMINAVTLAAKASNTKLNPNDPSNPFQIKYSVYNLYEVIRFRLSTVFTTYTIINTYMR